MNQQNNATKRAALVKVLILDVDGVLTDGVIGLSDSGEQYKNFNCKDGLGLRMLSDNGIHLAIITARQSKVVQLRAAELGIKTVYQNQRDKPQALAEILKNLQLTPEQACYTGDDLLDIAMMRRVGFAATVADASEEVKHFAQFVSAKKGGKGAVRELCEFILRAQNLWQATLDFYCQK